MSNGWATSEASGSARRAAKKRPNVTATVTNADTLRDYVHVVAEHLTDDAPISTTLVLFKGEPAVVHLDKNVPTNNTMRLVSATRLR